MKKLIEGIKDFFYDAIDYILIIFIIVAVVGVIGWRLDILFTKSPINTTTENNVIVSDSTDNNDNMSMENVEESENEQIVDQEKLESQDDESTQSNSYTEEVPEEIIKVEIPSGSLATNIANILYNKGLIDDKNQFLFKAQELGLDRKLKSGTFNIKRNSSLETIIKTIAN